MVSSDHKPVSAAFRVAVVKKDEIATKRVVFEILQDLHFDEIGAVVGDLDLVADEE